MGWTWWHEINPTIEAQRVVRVALSSVIDGSIDFTAGTDTIGSSTYKRRSGLTGAMFDATNPTPTTPVISVDQRRIDFRLEPDTSNVRAFYLGTDITTGVMAVYYIDSSSQERRLEATKGITDLQFSYYTDTGGNVHYDIVKVTATVSKDVLGTRNQPYHVEVVDSDFVYLKNALL